MNQTGEWLHISQNGHDAMSKRNQVHGTMRHSVTLNRLPSIQFKTLPKMDCVSASLEVAILARASARSRAVHSDPWRNPRAGGGPIDSSMPLVSPSLCQKVTINF